MADTRQYILNTLTYFDIFHYPLLKEEILRFHGMDGIAHQHIEECIDQLVEDQCIFHLGEFYSLHNDSSLATRRQEGNRLAIEQMKTAHRAAVILSRFPYVRGLAISGSLSKNYCTEKTDIDFFIITETGRLWIARTLMHLYKKFTFLTGKQKWFCMNYYVDEAGMEIKEKNIFTAMEIATMLPMQGKRTLDNFHVFNGWVKNFLPKAVNSTATTPEIKKGIFGRLIEFLLNNRLGNWVDDRFMKITERRWKKKEVQQMRNDHGIVMGMMVGKHYSKPNPAFFQDKVVERYNAKLDSLSQFREVPVKVG